MPWQDPPAGNTNAMSSHNKLPLLQGQDLTVDDARHVSPVGNYDNNDDDKDTGLEDGYQRQGQQ